ncbi:nuclear transport factor 2 family protein [Microbacterium aureliae]
MCDSIDDLLELEHRGWRSRCDGTAVEFFASVMAADTRVVLGDGAVMDRDQALSAMAGAPPWVRYELSQPRFLSLGPEAAALIYRARAFADDGEVPIFSGSMSSVYIRHAGALRLALFQQSHDLAA